MSTIITNTNDTVEEQATYLVRQSEHVYAWRTKRVEKRKKKYGRPETLILVRHGLGARRIRESG